MANIKGPNGNVANVSDSGRLSVAAVVTDLAETTNILGNAYMVSLSVTPAGANDLFFYLKNTGTAAVAINAIAVVASAPTRIEYVAVAGDPVYVGETAAQVTNLNLGSSNSLSVEANADTNITGLIENGLLGFEECAVADTRYKTNIPATIIIPQGKAVAFKRIEATGQIDLAVEVGVIA